MDYQTSKSRYILTSLAIIIVITAFILVGLNAYLMQKGGTGLSIVRPASQEELDESYKLGYEAARSKADTLCGDIKLSINSFTGTVISNDGKNLVVTQESLMSDPIADGISDDRTVLITPNTKIIKTSKKSNQQFMSELQAYETAQNAGNNTQKPPEDTVEQILKISDLSIGSKVLVSSNQDVMFLETVSSTIVQLQ